jgi:sugar phosphate isomerase/epimerase
MRVTPKLAMCNFIVDAERLRQTALARGFAGVDWTLTLEDLGATNLDEARLAERISRLRPLEVRYHCAFKGTDLGDGEAGKADAAMKVYQRACRLVARVEGRFMTVHVGLGRDSSEGLSWERSVAALADLVSYAKGLGVCVCLENLASGWSSRPELFEKLVRKSRAGVTLDIGHARMSPSVESQQYAFGDFVWPHHDRVFNAHIYHEERAEAHIAPQELMDIADRLQVLKILPCDWWVLELRSEEALFSTLDIVRRFLDGMPGTDSVDSPGMVPKCRTAALCANVTETPPLR